MNQKFSVVVLLLILLAPGAAFAATVDASLIPDGTYTVKVDRVIDSKHIQVTMDNGTQTTLSAGRDSVDFSKIKQNDQVKMSLIKGSVMVFLDMTSH